MKCKWTKLVSLCAMGIAVAGCAADVVHEDEQGAGASAQVAAKATWVSAGNGLDNTRNQPGETRIGPESARQLAALWTFQASGDLMGTPAVDATSLYVADQGGNLHAIDRTTGKARWQKRISEYTGVANDWARVTPAVTDDALFLGNQAGRNQDVGATVFAVDKATGEKRWATKVDAHPAAIITSSPVVYGDRVYVGVSSWEEFRAPGPYVCCSFRGSVVALDRKTGRVVWKFWTTPGPDEAPGYTGVGIWSSTPTVDVKRKSLYITTGNNYSVPKGVLDCQALPLDQIATCMAELPGGQHNYFDAVLALDLDTGKVKWVHHAALFDSFNGACLGVSPECPRPVGKDEDFGQGAILYTATVDGRQRQLLGAGQKNGTFWALNPDDGSVVWKTTVGPGGIFGGFEWGSASDGQRIYAAIANSESKPWTFASGESTRSGFWAGLDAATGKVLWQTRGMPAIAATARGSVSSANGVAFGGAYDAAGMMYAFDGKTGATLWSHASGGTVTAAPAIVDGTLYWGARNGKLTAFAPKAGSGPSTPTPTDPTRPQPTVPPTSWRGIYNVYFGDGTVGHCTNCHAEMGSASAAYTFLQSKGQIDGTRSKLVAAGSILTWFGGRMPPAGPASYPEAARDLRAWVAAGARND